MLNLFVSAWDTGKLIQILMALPQTLILIWSHSGIQLPLLPLNNWLIPQRLLVTSVNILACHAAPMIMPLQTGARPHAPLHPPLLGLF